MIKTTKWYQKSVYLLLALALVLSLGVVALPLAGTVSANPGDYYVATSGNDTSGDGSEGNPWRTIQHAIDSVSSSDTINVAAGTYTLTAPTWEGLIIDKSVTLRGTGTPTIDSTGAMVAVHITVDDVTLNGFRVSNASTMGVYLDGVSGCTVTSNRFEGLASGPIVKVKEEGSSNTISNNVFIGDDIETGIELGESGSNEVFGNDFSGTDWGTSATVISIGPSGSHPSDSNLVHDNTITSSGFQTGIELGWSDHNKIYDNEISGGEVGIKVSLDTYTEVYGNTIDSNTEKGIWLYHSENDSIYDNTISNNGEGIVFEPEEEYVYPVGMVYTPCKNNVIESNDISGNDVGVYIAEHQDEAEGNNAVHFNNIAGNANYGAQNDGSGTLDATNNWWGDASGPEHILIVPGSTDCIPPSEGGWNCDVCDENPDGLGDKVSDNVDYCPWLLEQYAPTKSTGTATGTGDADFSPDVGALEGLTAVGEETLPEEGKPDISFPHGFFSFTITGLTPCAHQTVTVTITLPDNVPVGTEYWKYHDPEGWVDVTSLLGDDDGDNVLTLTLTDGGLGDDDGVCNGVIVDQGGPGFYVPVGGEAYPVNKLGILMPWIALGMAVIAGATVVWRRRRTQE